MKDHLDIIVGMLVLQCCQEWISRGPHSSHILSNLKLMNASWCGVPAPGLLCHYMPLSVEF